MTLYLQRKISGCCPRCGDPSSDTSVLCEPHRIDASERVARHLNELRATRRKRKQCACCGCRSISYRCETCAMSRKVAHAREPRTGELRSAG